MSVNAAPLLAVAIVLTTLTAAGPASAQDPASFYDANCAACHTIGGGEQGAPDLKWVTLRHERQWLIRFVMDPEAMVASRDPRAVDMVKHWDGAVMPSSPGMTPELAEALLRYIDQQSNGAAAVAPVAQDAAPPVFTPADVSRGQALFTGTATTSHGMPPCVTCHAATGEGGIAGGGRLGRDLTQVSARMRGPRGVAKWLEAPPTPMMRELARRAPLTPEENRALTAFLEDLRARQESPATNQVARLAGAGVAGAVLGFVAVALVWRGRFTGVRGPLVRQRAASVRGGGVS